MARARVRPELISWVRENAGLSVEQVAKKTGTSVERVRRWEEGDLQPTIRQLRLLGRAARRPLAVFYLSEPPTRFQAIRDFRRLPGDPAAEGSYELRLAIRLALARREVGLELLESIGESMDFDLRADLDEDPVSVARRIRDALEVSLPDQMKWSGQYEGLNNWRAAVENLGVLVFQATGVSTAEMRGFSVAEQPLPIIVLNLRDAPNGRVFTLFHELVHLLLRQGGVCDLVDSAFRPPQEDRVEVFCNAVAAEALVPADALLELPQVRSHEGSSEWSDEHLRRIARAFSVSREVVLRRLLDLGRTTNAFYAETRARLLEEYERIRADSTGFASPDVKAVSHVGPSFTRLVLNSFYRERITSRDVSDYLGVKLRHLPKIEERVMGRPVLFRPDG